MQRESNPSATLFMQHLLRAGTGPAWRDRAGGRNRTGVSIITTLSDRYEESLVFREQDPSRGRALGQGKQLRVREGFTAELAALRMNRALPGGGSMGTKEKGEDGGRRGGESIWPRKRMCAKYKGLKHHSVLSNCKHFSIVGWRTRGDEAHEAGESGSWILRCLGAA